MAKRVFILPLSLALLALACGLISAPEPTATPTETLAPTASGSLTPRATATPTEPPTPDWQRHERDGFEIWLPETWESFPLDREALELMMDIWEATNPRVAEYVDFALQAGLHEQIGFWAIDTESKQFVSNVNIMSVPMAVSPSLYVTSISGELERTDATIVSTADSLEIGGLPAARIEYQMPVELPSSGLIVATGVQYAISTDSNTYVLTFTAAQEQTSEMAPIFEMSANSFRILKR